VMIALVAVAVVAASLAMKKGRIANSE
jgi:hypothetical protein